MNKLIYIPRGGGNHQEPEVNNYAGDANVTVKEGGKPMEIEERIDAMSGSKIQGGGEGGCANMKEGEPEEKNKTYVRGGVRNVLKQPEKKTVEESNRLILLYSSKLG